MTPWQRASDDDAGPPDGVEGGLDAASTSRAAERHRGKGRDRASPVAAVLLVLGIAILPIVWPGAGLANATIALLLASLAVVLLVVSAIGRRRD